MALTPEMCTAVGSSGLDSSGGFRLPDVDSLDVAARNLSTHAAGFRSGIDAAARTWSGLGASYVSDESPTVLAAFGKVTPLAARVASDAASTSSALSAFSSTCRELQQRLASYGQKVRELDAAIDAFPTSVEKTTIVAGGEQVTTQVSQHWNGDAELTARHNALSAEVKAIHDEYLAAQDSCAAALAGVSGGEVRKAERIHHPDLHSGNWVDEALFAAGTFFGIQKEDNQNPWGKDTVPYRLNGPLGFLQGLGAGAVELVDGVWSLNPFANQAKRDQAWGGINTLIGDAGMLASVPFTWALNNQQWERDRPGIQRALDDFGRIGPAFIHLDDADNAGWAIGAGTFNVVSTVATAGGGAALDGAALASKAGLAAERLSIATMDSAKLGRLSTVLGSTAQGLFSAGTVLGKPGSLALKISDLVMPQTTAKVLDTLTGVKVNTWMAVSKAPAAVWEHAVARPQEGLSTFLRSADHVVSRVVPSPAGTGVLGHSPLGHAADSLDAAAGKVRAEQVPVAPKTQVPPPAEPFPKPENLQQTVVLKHGEANFPVSQKDNFAARTGLKPNTEYVVEHRMKMHHITGNPVDSVEKYYTDATGKVVRVDTFAGVRSAWSPELNKPMPNVTYNTDVVVDGGLRNRFTIVTDDFAKARSIEAHITGTLKGDLNRNGWQQLLAGKRVGGSDYEGGHLIASLFGGPGERANLLAQHMFQNRGHGTPNVDANTLAFYQLEKDLFRQVQHRIDTGQPIDFHMKVEALTGPKPGLPSSITVDYRFAGGRAESEDFDNLIQGVK